MAELDDDQAKALATPLGQAFVRLLEDPDFASEVIESPERVAEQYGLDDDDMAALAGDARSLEDTAKGFSFSKMDIGGALNFSGGLLTPDRLGMPGTRGWSGCLTMT